MAGVASRALRSDTRCLLMRAEADEDVVITVDGRPGAALGPPGSRPQWMQRREFPRRDIGHQAEPALAAELRELSSDTTDVLR